MCVFGEDGKGPCHRRTPARSADYRLRLLAGKLLSSRACAEGRTTKSWEVNCIGAYPGSTLPAQPPTLCVACVEFGKNVRCVVLPTKLAFRRRLLRRRT